MVREVALDSGQVNPLLEIRERGLLVPRQWSREQGTFSFSLLPCNHTLHPWDDVRFYRVQGGTHATVARPGSLVATDGTHTLYIPSITDASNYPPRLDETEVEAPGEFRSWTVRRVVWMHHRPVAYVTSYAPANYSCFGPMFPPPRLFRVDFEGTRKPIQERSGLAGLVVLAISPDDAYVLAATLKPAPKTSETCDPDFFGSIRVMERSLLENSPALEAIDAGSVRIDRPASSIDGNLQGFVGWVL